MYLQHFSALRFFLLIKLSTLPNQDMIAMPLLPNTYCLLCLPFNVLLKRNQTPTHTIGPCGSFSNVFRDETLSVGQGGHSAQLLWISCSFAIFFGVLNIMIFFCFVSSRGIALGELKVCSKSYKYFQSFRDGSCSIEPTQHPVLRWASIFIEETQGIFYAGRHAAGFHLLARGRYWSEGQWFPMVFCPSLLRSSPSLGWHRPQGIPPAPVSFHFNLIPLFFSL